MASIHQRLPKLVRRYRLPTEGRAVVHIGGHLGQEAPIYQEAGYSQQVWVEPQPEVFAGLVRTLGAVQGATAIHAACGEAAGMLDMFITKGDSESCSLLEPGALLEAYPGTAVEGKVQVRVERLDDLLTAQAIDPAGCGLLVMDTQGYELHVLRGCPKLLACVPAVLTEVAERALYKGGALLHEVDAMLLPLGFVRVMLRLGSKRTGDALYVQREVLPPLQRWRTKLFGSARR